jgi:NAD+ synthase (glutamine-hydrolysing)
MQYCSRRRSLAILAAMRLIKIGLGPVNSTVGAVESNTARLVEVAGEMAAADVTIACFPEQVIGGYPPEDLVQWPAFVSAQHAALQAFAAETAHLHTVFVVGLTVGLAGQLFNAAAVVHGGRVLGYVPKEKLPTYSVFYEARTLSRGAPGLLLEHAGVPLGDVVFRLPFGVLAVEVCEDTWSPDGPLRRRCFSGAEVVVSISASPYRVGFAQGRREMLATRSADNQATLAYVNRVGAQDGLIFDGGGWVFQNGRTVHEAERFRDAWSSCVVDLERTTRMRVENTTWRTDLEEFQRTERRVPLLAFDDARCVPGERHDYPAPPGDSFFLPPAGAERRDAREEALDELFTALALGVGDYVVKTGAFRHVGVALSGGRDSLLTLLIAWRAVTQIRAGRGEDAAPQLAAFYLPSRHSGRETRAAAETICRELDVPLTVVDIDEAYDRELAATRAMLGGAEPDDLTRQNVQARIRAARMWNWSNTAGGLFLQAGDMSEKAVGYTTIGGDLEGALSVIANVPKTVVIALLRRLRDRFGFKGIDLCLATLPGPELSDEQTAEAELMPFPVLDACLHLFAGEKLSPDEVAQVLPGCFPAEPPEQLRAWAYRFAELFTRSIYKWVQSPLSLHIGTLDLERERALQLPVVQRTEWGRDDA